MLRRVHEIISAVEAVRELNRFFLLHLDYNPFREILLRVAYGNYEPYSSKIFRGLIKEGMVVLDIGAGWGHYSRIASGPVGKTGIVLAFEPDPTNYRILVKTTKGLASVRPMPMAVSNETGRKTFYQTDHFGDQSLYADTKGRKTIVNVVKLDDYLAGLAQINVVKMDIDGGELEALRGMERLIRNSTDIVILTEFMPSHLVRSGFSPIDFLDELIKHGFKLYAIDERNEQIYQVKVADLISVRVINLLCVKNQFVSVVQRN